MLNDISSTNSVASRGHTQYKGYATDIQGGASPGANDIVVGSGVASTDQTERDFHAGSASVESGVPINGTNDIGSINTTATLANNSNFISAKKTNEGTSAGTAPLF